MKETLRRLEFNRVVEMLTAQTRSEGGKNKVLTLEPSSDIDTVKMRLDETEEALGLLHHQEPAFLNEVPDIRPQLSKVRAGGMIYPAEILEVLQVLQASRRALDFLAPGRGERAQWLRSGLTENSSLERSIKTVIDEAGEVKDNASPELHSIRSSLNTLRSRIKDYLRDFIRSASNQKYLQENLITERGGRYVVPVKAEYRHEVKGIVHDESASGATVYIEPELVVAANNEIRKLEAEEAREVDRILRRLSGRIAEYADDLQSSLESLETLDFWVAKARLALKMDAFRPHLNSEGRMRLVRARHPLLYSRAVPIDLELGSRFDILVITGPNTGGKTVALKTVGLLALMTTCGLFIPALSESEMPVFDKILVDIGDEQSIEQSLSTFSAHMTNINIILNQAGRESLVILDELGAGTDPLEGAALARAILERLLELECRVLVSTHHSELKTFAYQHDRVENACVEFDPVSLRPTYRLTIGLPGQSNAFEIAEKLGFDTMLVQRARQYVPQQEQEISRLLTDLKEQRFQARAEKEAARNLQKQLEEERNRLQHQALEMEREKEQFINRIQAEASQYLETVSREIEGLLDEFKRRAREAEAPKWHEIEEMRKRYQQAVPDPGLRVDPDSQPVSPQKVKPGDYVEIKSVKQKGYVLEANGDEVVVQVGIMRLTVPRKDVVVRSSPEEIASRQRNRSYLENRKNIPTEINLRGMLAEQALDETERYVEEAFLAGLDRVRIIHGKGTGALRRAVREHLAGHPYIKEFRDGENSEGGIGVTIAYLNK
ncbi:MAG: endonuclease MutS2 [Syntrophomonadaceae bacterium]|jgi:DNA mismatch repair protein MutS2|nr:endonuclease MutS2 [Syntrophomonadaceae bacterium]